MRNYYREQIIFLQLLKILQYIWEVSANFLQHTVTHTQVPYSTFHIPRNTHRESCFKRNSFLRKMAVNGLCASTEDFLKRCEQSGDAAYSTLRSLLERLEDPVTRKEARVFLALLQKRFAIKEASDQCLQTYHFQIQDIVLEQYEGPLLFSLSY